MSRLSLSESDKSVRDWFVKTTESLGCQVTVDRMVSPNMHSFPLDTSNSFVPHFRVMYLPSEKANPPAGQREYTCRRLVQASCRLLVCLGRDTVYTT